MGLTISDNAVWDAFTLFHDKLKEWEVMPTGGARVVVWHRPPLALGRIATTEAATVNQQPPMPFADRHEADRYIRWQAMKAVLEAFAKEITR